MSEIQLMHYKQKTPEETVQFLQDILKNMKVEVTEHGRKEVPSEHMLFA